MILLRDSNWSAIQIIAKIMHTNPTNDTLSLNRVTKDSFTDFINERVFKDTAPLETLEQLTDRIDVDKDGFIGENDIAAFLSRYGYAESKQALKSAVLQGSAGQTELFPKEPLSEDKMDIVLRDIRMALTTKHINYIDFVKSMDPSDNGFVVINDFSVGLDKVIKLSKPIKDGLFAYADKMKIGMVDYPTLLTLFKRTVIDKKGVRLSYVSQT